MSTEDFKRIVESLRIAVAIADPKGVVAFANPSFVQLAGDPERGVSGQALPSFFHKDDARRVQQVEAQHAERHAARRDRKFARRATGRRGWRRD